MNSNTLSDLGVGNDLLSEDEKSFLDENGYLNLGKLLSDEQLDTIRDRISFLIREEGEKAGSEVFDSPYIRHPKEEGADRLADLVNKGSIFDLFYTHPKVLAAVAHVVGPDLKLSSLNYRAAKPGMGAQKLHVDWHEAVNPGDFKVCNTIWLLDDFNQDNGPTRVVPGTHKNGRLPQDELDDPWATHPDQVLIKAPAGTVVAFNSHTWHGGTTNTTDQYRRSIHSYFCRRDQPQQIDQSRFIRQETLDRLSSAAVDILGLKS